MALHEQPAKSDEWYTPPRVFEALAARFNMDAASPGWKVTPWVPADRFLTENALGHAWMGFIWLNPPFGGRNGIVPWLDKFFDHADGVALTPDRTSAPWWQAAARKADAILFVGGKIRFIPGPGATASSPAQGTTLMASAPAGVRALQNAADAGLGLLLYPPEGLAPTSVSHVKGDLRPSEPKSSEPPTPLGEDEW